MKYVDISERAIETCHVMVKILQSNTNKLDDSIITLDACFHQFSIIFSIYNQVPTLTLYQLNGDIEVE